MIPSIETIASTIDWPVEKWHNRCHGVSLKVVRSGLLGEPGPNCRVVRGFTSGYGIHGQHSWIALGRPFDESTKIIDVTAHTWGLVSGIVESTVGDAYRGLLRDDDDPLKRGYVAHGFVPGSIWQFGRPDPVGELMELDHTGMSDDAKSFLGVLGPLSAKGWLDLVTYPHGDWPAHEICEAIVEQVPNAHTYLPIDVVAHVTDCNPSNLYW